MQCSEIYEKKDFVINFFLQKREEKFWVLIKRFCKLDSETLTSISREPVGLNFNQKASRVRGWSPHMGGEGEETPKTGGLGWQSPPNTIFVMRILGKNSSASKTPLKKNVLESFFTNKSITKNIFIAFSLFI